MTDSTSFAILFVACAAACLLGLAAARLGHRRLSTPLFLLASILGCAAALLGGT